MAPFATLHTLVGEQHLHVLKIQAAANINSLLIETPSHFVMHESNKTAEFLAKFPLGKIPALETASGFCLTESSAIAYFISDSGPRREQLLGSDVEERALVQQWIFFADEMLQPSLLPLLLPHLGRANYDENIEMVKVKELHRWLKYLEEHLEGREWLVSNTTGPSLADLSVGSSMAFGFRHYIDMDMRNDYPRLEAWYKRLVRIPEVKDGFVDVTLVEKRPIPMGLHDVSRVPRH
ncbi:glutathione S-transferase [Ilyonectria destructans]|nr:glutathione S-transferase [Ilyonectria destructans]